MKYKIDDTILFSSFSHTIRGKIIAITKDDVYLIGLDNNNHNIGWPSKELNKASYTEISKNIDHPYMWNIDITQIIEENIINFDVL